MWSKKQISELAARRGVSDGSREQQAEQLREALSVLKSALPSWGFELVAVQSVVQGSKRGARGEVMVVWLYPEHVHGWGVLLSQDHQGVQTLVQDHGATPMEALLAVFAALAMSATSAGALSPKTDEGVEPPDATFATLARARMHALGLTQQQLADRMGILQPNIGKYLSGRHQPGLDLILRWAQALECSPRELVPLRAQAGPSASAAPMPSNTD